MSSIEKNTFPQGFEEMVVIQELITQERNETDKAKKAASLLEIDRRLSDIEDPLGIDDTDGGKEATEEGVLERWMKVLIDLFSTGQGAKKASGGDHGVEPGGGGHGGGGDSGGGGVESGGGGDSGGGGGVEPGGGGHGGGERAVNGPPQTLLNENGGSDYGGFSTAPQTGAYSPEETAKVGGQLIESLMRDLGITREQAAGVVGNIMQESRLNPGINQGPGSDIGPPNGSGLGYGWVQWSGSRKDEFKAYAAEHGLDPASPAANYGFLLKELTSPSYSDVLANLKGADSATAAAIIINDQYEILHDDSLPNRINNANTALGFS